MRKVRARFDAEGAVIQQNPEGTWERPRSQADWARFDATSESAIARQAAEDEAEAAREAGAWTRRVRRRTGLSQSEFARRIGVPLVTLRDWERGKDFPQGAARALLRVIDRMPEAAIKALVA